MRIPPAIRQKEILFLMFTHIILQISSFSLVIIGIILNANNEIASPVFDMAYAKTPASCRMPAQLCGKAGKKHDKLRKLTKKSSIKKSEGED